MATQISHCPFCGVAPKKSTFSCEGDPVFRVRCEAKECPVRPSCLGHSLDAALAKWNTRTPARKPLGLKKGNLSPGQKRVFDAIVKFISINGFPPTNRDLCKELGYASPNAIFGFTQALARKNWIRQQPNKSRSITLL